MANPTTNYGFVLPTSSDLVTDLPADFDVALQGVDTRLKALQPGTTLGDLAYSSATANTNTRLPIGTNGQVLGVVGGVPAWTTDASGMTNPMTTTGDTIYSSSGSTPARLGIGTTGQVLTVAGGVPSWATPGGSATNFALINSGGTSLTGSGTITISSISGKNQLAIYIVDASAGASASFTLRVNSDTGSNYYFVRLSIDGTSTVDLGGGNDASFPLGAQGSSAANAMGICEIVLNGCNAAGIKTFASQSRASGTSSRSSVVRGHYVGSSTVSSISLISDTGNFDAGTIYVYGA